MEAHTRYAGNRGSQCNTLFVPTMFARRADTVALYLFIPNYPVLRSAKPLSKPSGLSCRVDEHGAFNEIALA